MKARLLCPDSDFDWRTPLQAAAAREAARNRRQARGPAIDPRAGLPWNEGALTADLGLDTLFQAIAREDDCIFEVARRVIFAGARGDLDTILYRQSVLQDCLSQPAVIRKLYAVAVEANEKEKRHYFSSFFARYPDAVLRYAAELMADLLGSLRDLRRIADAHAQHFTSEGLTRLFAELKRELDGEFFTQARHHLEQLKFRHGVLLTAQLGDGNRGRDYVLRGLPQRQDTWQALWGDILDWLRRRLPNRGDAAPAWLRPRQSPVYSFSLHPRDEAGARMLGEVRNRGIALIAGALSEAAEHVRDFFGMLQGELAFYVGCLNLHEELGRRRLPVCLPQSAPANERLLSCRGLYDIGLALQLERGVVGNDVDADGKDLVVVTGANTGGKSTFLRSLGLAQLMMQSGMFVGAETLHASLCQGLFTHYIREEDTAMKSGKLDEELSRMSEIVDHLGPHALMLFNESFAATNEREGSEIARQVITALLEKGVRIACVTHLYELARGFYEKNAGNALFLRAERARTYKLREGEPLPTSFGEDLYREIFTEADRATLRAAQ
jgi:MutS domain V